MGSRHFSQQGATMTPDNMQYASGVEGEAKGPDAERADRPSTVLVHGAFADGTGWAEVIRLLQKKGHNVTAAQNPLTSYSDDVQTTKRLIDAQPGTVVVVGHSYGGAVITSAAAGSTKVKALVYVAAFAPTSARPLVRTSRSIPRRWAPHCVPMRHAFSTSIAR